MNERAVLVSLRQVPKVTDHKLHVTGARCFGASSRDLLAQVCGGDNLFSQGHSVIFKEDQLEFIADNWVIIDDLGDAADKLDDLFRQVITRRGLAAYHHGSGDKWRGRVPFYSIIQSDDVQAVQQLSLVFVYAFHLST